MAPHARKGRDGRFNRLMPALLLCFVGIACLLLTQSVRSQSGRNVKKSSDAKAKQVPAPSRSAAPIRSTVSEQDLGDEIIKIASRLVPIPASVTDEAGRPLTNLGLQDFELQIDGQVKPISELMRSESPVRMAVLFDNSASITATREFEKRAAIRFFQRVIRPIDQAALFSISTTAELVQPLTNDVEKLVRAIESFGKPVGATALLDGLAQAATYLRPQQGRRVIVIISDGADTISDTSFESALSQVIAADCQVYAVQTGGSDNPNLRDLVAERRLQELAEQTGGMVYVPSSTEDLDRAFAQIAADLAQQYVLSYYATDDPQDGRFRRISLLVKTHPGARVRTRRGYYSPKG
jgi:Ca-activated chloride channel family protein